MTTRWAFAGEFGPKTSRAHVDPRYGTAFGVQAEVKPAKQIADEDEAAAIVFNSGEASA